MWCMIKIFTTELQLMSEIPILCICSSNYHNLCQILPLNILTQGYYEWMFFIQWAHICTYTNLDKPFQCSQ